MHTSSCTLRLKINCDTVYRATQLSSSDMHATQSSAVPISNAYTIFANNSIHPINININIINFLYNHTNSVPYAAHDICTQREKFRAQLEHVSRIVRAYNIILSDLTPSERRLFADHLRRLDKRIHQGIY